MTSGHPPAALARFIDELSVLLAEQPFADRAAPPQAFLDQAAAALARLVAQDDWLDAPYRRPHPEFYQQYQLYLDPEQRFSVVSFVWGPGQRTPIHDHQVWGLVGMLSGVERCQRYRLKDDVPEKSGPPLLLQPGAVETLSPRLGDIHLVENALADAVSISIHVYGADIGQVERWVFPPSGARKKFISGYANTAETPLFVKAS